MTVRYTLAAVEKTYNGRRVLAVPDLTINAGEILALVGPSGAGKSTLLRLLALLEAPSAGTVTLHLDERHVTQASATIDDRRQLAMVFQRPVLMSRSVRANVAYGLKLRGKQQVNERVDAALERVRLSHLADARPHTLSGGELQRVSIARAMILEPRVLILDEPTANLDPYNIQIIEDFLQGEQTRHKTTLVIVTHNIFQARRLASRVGLIFDGELVEVADTETFFEQPNDPRTRAFISGDVIY